MIKVPTRDGECPVIVSIPAGSGPWPAVVLYMDAGGIRPAISDMSERLAEAGFVVLLPDLFYRFGPYEPFVPKEVFANDFRAILGPLMNTTDNNKAVEDTQALLTHIDERHDVDGSKLGAVGFCMGGGMALSAAGAKPDRFSAVASFHGGNLATDKLDSPHRLAHRILAETYIAAAYQDESYPPPMAERLEAAFDEGGVRFTAETYPAAHGWMMPDFPVYDAAAAERGWREMLALFTRNLMSNAT